MDGLRVAGSLKSKTKTKQDDGGNVMGLLIALIVLILVALAIAVSCIKIVPQRISYHLVGRTSFQSTIYRPRSEKGFVKRAGG